MSTVTAIDLAAPVSQAVFGELVGISQQAVADLQADGVLAKGATGREWLLAYTGRLREQAAGRSLELVAQRARLACEQADRVALLNQQARREVLPVALLETVLARVSRQIAAMLEALPVQIKRQSPNLTAEDIALINREIARMRNAAASIRLEDVDGSLGAESGASERAGTLPGGGTDDALAVG